jgi:hypothetical protein
MHSQGIVWVQDARAMNMLVESRFRKFGASDFQKVADRADASKFLTSLIDI